MQQNICKVLGRLIGERSGVSIGHRRRLARDYRYDGGPSGAPFAGRSRWRRLSTCWMLLPTPSKKLATLFLDFDFGFGSFFAFLSVDVVGAGVAAWEAALAVLPVAPVLVLLGVDEVDAAGVDVAGADDAGVDVAGVPLFARFTAF